MHRTLKICLVCAAWAAIGTQVALSFTPFWLALPLGLVLGSLCGHLTVDWRTVVWAIPIAWRRTTSWRPDWAFWRRAIAVAVTFVMWIGSIALPLVLLLTVVRAHLPLSAVEDTGLRIVMFCVVTPLMTILCCIKNVEAVNWEEEYKKVEPNALTPFYNLIFRNNFWVILPIGLAVGSWELFKTVPGKLAKATRTAASGLLLAINRVISAMVVAGRFLWNLYRLIHTEERWLCSVDIACGVALGYWSASPLIGGASGAAFWLVNRLLIAGLCLRTLPVRAR